MYKHRMLFSPEDPGGEGAAPNPLDAKVDTLSKGLETLMSSMTGLATSLQTLDSKFEELSAARTPSEPKPVEPNVDLETASNAELVAYTIGKVKSILDEAVKPVNDRVDKVFSELDTREAVNAVNSMKSDHKDFLEWKGEIGSLLKENPTLSIQRAYLLARNEHPEKASQLDEKFAPKSKGGQEVFFGLLPTSSRTVDSTRMKPNEAAVSAWNSVMAQLGEGAEKLINPR